MDISYQERVHLIRGYENDCYRICHFILECEHLALTAAQQALFLLINDDAFFLQNDFERAIQTKIEARKAAIQIHFNSLTVENKLESIVL